VRGWAKANGVPVIDCARGVRKHQIAEEHLSAHGPKPGVFLILVARAPATVYEVRRSAQGVIYELVKKRSFVNHYSFHIWDGRFGHLTVKMSGHPPSARRSCSTGTRRSPAPRRRRESASPRSATASPPWPTRRRSRGSQTPWPRKRRQGLREVVDRWIYSACLIFGLDLAEQERTRFRYDYSVYQVEYSRNLLFKRGDQMEEVFQDMLDRHRGHLDLREIRTIFGKGRHALDAEGDSRVRSELARRPQYGLTVFKLDFGRLSLKAYTKGERVLRFETIAHNTEELACGRVLTKFGVIVARLRAILERALAVLRGMERAFVSDDTLEQLPRPATVGRTRVGGIDIGRPRMRTALRAVLALAAAPHGFTSGELAAKARELGGPAMSGYDRRLAAYDLKKMRGKGLAARIDGSHRYQLLPDGVATITALVVLREEVLKPLLAATAYPLTSIRLKTGRKSRFWDRPQDHHQRLRRQMYALLANLRLLPLRRSFVDTDVASA
jgi:hypothetical protein